LGAGPPTQDPLEQASLVVQALPSLHAAVLLVNTQPFVGSQMSSVQTLASSHTGGEPPTQVPPEQVSPVVQAFPSLQALVLFTCSQPEAGLQESSVQPLPSSHTGGGPLTQAPPEQASPVVQALPSSHGVVLGVNTQTPPSHELSVHRLPSSHWLS
jgi:hypothetical protein